MVGSDRKSQHRERGRVLRVARTYYVTLDGERSFDEREPAA
jgi:hypothetical protein